MNIIGRKFSTSPLIQIFCSGFFPSYLSLGSEISATESLLPITFRPKWERGEVEAAQGPLPPPDLPLERASRLAKTAFENNCQRRFGSNDVVQSRTVV